MAFSLFSAPSIVSLLVSIDTLKARDPVSYTFAEVATDEKGVCSSVLRSILEDWPEGKKKPKAFYTVPVCR